MSLLKHSDHDVLHIDYFILALGLGCGGGAYFIFANQTTLQVGSAIATGIFYILWGTIHHAKEGDFHLKIILEYTLIAGLAVALLLSLIFRA